ncbi:MAG: phosphate acyltransferase PlsX [Alphaproteobacteria bacterium]
MASKGPTIALDAMGGDAAPEIVVAGAAIARERFPDARFLIFGGGDKVAELVAKDKLLVERSELREASTIISDDAKPSQALRSGRDSSMWCALDAVKQGEASAMVSAGNTGALMAISKFVLRMPMGVDRPAMASIMPTANGETVMLDLGANIECDADNLFQFAILGALFARSTLAIERPTIGLLNVGAEELKGSDTLKAAAQMLRDYEGQLPLTFHGFIEGDDIIGGKVDVVVTDGFSGNVALKTAEGAARLFGQFMRSTFRSSPMAGLGYLLARPALRRLKDHLDPRKYNGAVFLGLNGITVKSHGGSDALGFANAVGVAVDMAQHGFLENVRTEFERLHTNALEDKSASL